MLLIHKWLNYCVCAKYIELINSQWRQVLIVRIILKQFYDSVLTLSVALTHCVNATERVKAFRDTLECGWRFRHNKRIIAHVVVGFIITSESFLETCFIVADIKEWIMNRWNLSPKLLFLKCFNNFMIANKISLRWRPLLQRDRYEITMRFRITRKNWWWLDDHRKITSWQQFPICKELKKSIGSVSDSKRQMSRKNYVTVYSHRHRLSLYITMIYRLELYSSCRNCDNF